MIYGTEKKVRVFVVMKKGERTVCGQRETVTQTCVPLTRSGRQRKLGRMTGCCIPFALLVGGIGRALVWLIA